MSSAHITRTVFRFEILHSSSQTFDDLGTALAEAMDGSAIGEETVIQVETVPDSDVTEAEIALGGDGTFLASVVLDQP